MKFYLHPVLLVGLLISGPKAYPLALPLRALCMSVKDRPPPPVALAITAIHRPFPKLITLYIYLLNILLAIVYVGQPHRFLARAVTAVKELRFVDGPEEVITAVLPLATTSVTSRPPIMAKLWTLVAQFPPRLAATVVE